ncbi:MAG TPA: hypothetical protein PLS90_00880 [Candidatus Sumerlaeota bacterium]|nr:hypothetical protein [Candidatus Sumerlaeota bacterium]
MTFTIEYEQEDDGRWLGSHASHDDQDLRERTWSLPFLLIDHFVCDEICHSKRKPSSRACPTTVKKSPPVSVVPADLHCLQLR